MAVELEVWFCRIPGMVRAEDWSTLRQKLIKIIRLC